MATLDQIRSMGEAEFRTALERLDRRHRAKLIAALEQYGHPRFIPQEVWDEIKREQEEELVAAYLLLMMAGDDWTTEEIAAAGVATRSASQSEYALNAARRAQAAAQATTDTLRNRITRSVEDSLASRAGGVGNADYQQAVDDVFTDARRNGIATTETTGSLTVGQRTAAGRIGGDGAALADGQSVEIEMRWRTETDDRVCPRCSPLEGQPEEVWARVFPEGPGEQAHVNCRCWLDPVVVVLARQEYAA